MKLTDKELNFVLSECVKNLMLEEAPNDSSNTFNKKYIQNIVGKNTDPSTVQRYKSGQISNIDDYNEPNISKQKWGKRGTAAAAGVVGYQSLKHLGRFASGVLGSLGPELVGIAALLGGGAIIGGLVNNITVLNKFKNLKLPTIALNVPKYAELAVKEKVKAQQLCIEIQKELNTTITAYNKVFGDTKTINDLFNGAEVTFRDAKKGGKYNNAKINTNIDFTDKYAGKNENRIKGQILEGINELQAKYNFFASGIQQDEAEEHLLKICEFYKRAYSNWMEWVRYIQALAKKFPEHCNWESMMDGKSQNNTILGKAKNALKDRFKDFSTGESLDDDPTDDKLILVVINLNWEYTVQNKQMGSKNPTKYSGILAQQQDKGVLYCIANNIVENEIIKQGDIIEYQYEQSDIYSKVYKYSDVVSTQPTKNPQIAWLLYKEANERMTKKELQQP